jgi:hypothetical protein
MSSKVEVFRNDDRSYTSWLTDHPRGFLISTRATNSDRPQVHFHSVSCGVHARNAGSVAENAFTGRYVKACSASILALHAYAEKHYPVRPRHVCGCCKVTLTDALGIASTNHDQRPNVDKRRSANPSDKNSIEASLDSEQKQLHPLVQGLLSTLPDPDVGERWTLEMRVKWLQTAANIFDLIYTNEGDIRVEASAK